MPMIWEEIEYVTKSWLEETEHSNDRKLANARLEAAEKRIAGRYDRIAIDALIQDVDAKLPSSENVTRYPAALSMISANVIAEIADPKDAYGLKSCGGSQWGKPWPGLSWYGKALAAIDLYHDTRSRNLLVQIAVKEGKFGWTGDGEGHACWDSPSVYALGFLRSYEPQEIRPEIEAALRAEAAKERPKVLANAIYATRGDYLRALLESWRYATSLSAEKRNDYRDCERRLWRALTLAPGWGDRKAGEQFRYAAGTFEKHWKQGDDRFLLRIFEEPTSTIEETRIAEHLVHRFSADAKKRLEAMAKSDSPKAAAARRALEEASRQHQ